MDVDNHLLEKYFKGACTPEEVAAVEKYLLQESTPAMDDYLMETWHQVEQEKATTGTPAKVSAAGKVIKTRYSWYSAAAVILVLISAGAWLWQSQREKQTLYTAAVQLDTIYNAGSNMRLVSMPDGSRVWLNAHALLAYSNNYNDTTRELWLKGEAYFEVAKDDQRPFSVHVGELVTTALGTSFNIATANKADGSIAVSLVTGKVSVSTADFAYVLNPGQMLLYKKGMPPTHIARFSVNEILDWKNGKLIFDNTTLEDAFAKLQSRYDCKIVLENKQLAKRKVTGSFNANETLEQILASLQYVHNFSYAKTGINTYVIKR
jgi:ferric-dicitrate binding protein FerR (iron transport regulator)